MRIIHPYILLVLIPIVPVMYLTIRRFTSRTRWLHFGLRLLVGGAIITAIAGIEFRYSANTAQRFYLIDDSDSIPGDRQSIRRQIQRSMDDLPSRSTATVIAFAADPSVEYGPAPPAGYEPGTTPSVSRSQTDIQAALALARSLHKKNARAQAILISDGNQTRGDLQQEALRFAAERIPLFVLPVERPDSDVRVELARQPGSVRPGEKFSVTARLIGNGSAQVTARSDEAETASDTLPVGGNALWQTEFTLQKPGLHQIIISAASATDRISQNNQCTAAIYVAGPPRLLVVGRVSAELASAAAKAGYDVQTIPPGQVGSAAELQQYDALILNDAPAWAFGLEALSAIQQYTESGGGLIMAGTTGAFGPGGYASSPVEEVLPVRCDPQEKQSKPAELALVIDQSGSMAETAAGRPKISYAQEGVILVARQIKASDRLTVIAFDSTARTVAQVDRPDQLRLVQDAVNQLIPHGSTDVNAALEAALQSFGGTTTEDGTMRHVILLSDGLSKQPVDATLLASRFSRAGVSVSVVATGDRTNESLLKQLAKTTGGSYYSIADMAKLPEIMAREARPSTDDYVKASPEGFPAGVAESSPLKLSPPSSRISRYVLVKPKNSAETVMHVADAQPLLVLGRSGTGKAVAFASDAGALGDYAPRLWAEVLRWAMRPSDSSIAATAFVADGMLHIEAADSSEQPRALNAMITMPGGKNFTVPLNQNAPNLYKAKISAGEPGIYAISIVDMASGSVAAPDGQASAPVARAAAVVDYSDEWKNLRTDTRLLSTLAESTGGQVLSDLSQLPNLETTGMNSLGNGAWIVILLALFCFLIDLALP